MKKEIIIYTDGSSLGNPGHGGWGVIFLANHKQKELGGHQKDVTNNQMELTAFLKALETLTNRKVENYKITIFSDSKYVLTGIGEWIHNWKKNNWKTANKKPVKNKELWIKIDELKTELEHTNDIVLKHVKAHNGEEFNERVDDIARWSAEEKKFTLKK